MPAYKIIKFQGGTIMSDNLFKVIMALIPVFGAIITGFVVPYLKTKISATQIEEIIKWVTKAVQAAEVLFDAPKSGEAKREYVINFIDTMFNSKKEVITKEQIRVLLESAWKEMMESEV